VQARQALEFLNTAFESDEETIDALFDPDFSKTIVDKEKREKARNDLEFMNEVRPAFRAPRFAIIGGRGGSRSQDLIADMPSLRRPRHPG
jgi:hypothetical protein